MTVDPGSFKPVTPPPQTNRIYTFFKTSWSKITGIFTSLLRLIASHRPEETSLKKHDLTIVDSLSSNASSTTASPEPSPKASPDALGSIQKTHKAAEQTKFSDVVKARAKAFLMEKFTTRNPGATPAAGAFFEPNFLMSLAQGDVSEKEIKDCLFFLKSEGAKTTPNSFYQALQNLLTLQTPYNAAKNQAFLTLFTRLDPEERHAFMSYLTSDKATRPKAQQAVSCFEKCLLSLEPKLSKEELSKDPEEIESVKTQKKLISEKKLAMVLHPELKPLFRAMDREDFSEQKTTQLLRHLATVSNYPHIQKAILKKLSLDDVQKILHAYATSYLRDDDFDPFTKELIHTFIEMRHSSKSSIEGKELISSTDLFLIFKKLPQSSQGIAEIFVTLNKEQQQDLLVKIQADGPESIVKFENMILNHFSQGSAQRKHLEKTLLDFFHPEIKGPFKTYEKLVKLLTTGFKYADTVHEALAKLTKQDLESIHFPKGVSHHNLLTPVFLDTIFNAAHEEGLAHFMQKIFASHGNDFTAEEKYAIDNLVDHKFTLYKFMAEKESQPLMALEALGKLEYTYTKTPLPSLEQLRLAKNALAYAQAHNIVIPASCIPSALAGHPELVKDVIAISTLNTCFDMLKTPESRFSSYVMLAGKEALERDRLSFLNNLISKLPDLETIEAELKKEKSALASQVPSATTQEAQSPYSRLLASYDEYDPLATKKLDTVRGLFVPPSQFEKFANYKLAQLDAALSFIEACKVLNASPERKAAEIAALATNPELENLCRHPFDADYISLACILYGSGFFKDVFLGTSDERPISFFNDFASSGTRHIEEQFHMFFGDVHRKKTASKKWKKPEDYKEPKILHLSRMNPEIARLSLARKLLAYEEFFDACIFKKGLNFVVNAALLTTLSPQEANELKSYIEAQGIDIIDISKQNMSLAPLFLEKGLLNKQQYLELLLHKQGEGWAVVESLISQLAGSDLDSLISMIPKERQELLKVSKQSPTLALHLHTCKAKYKGVLFGESEFSENDLFESIIYKNTTGQAVVHEAAVANLSNKQLFDLLLYAHNKSLPVDSLKPFVDHKCGFSDLFIIGPKGTTIINEEKLSRGDAEPSFDNILKYLEIFHPDNQEALFTTKDYRSLSEFTNGRLDKGKLIKSAFYDNHLNKKLVVNMPLAELEALKLVCDKAKNASAIEFVETILEAKRSST